MGVRTQMIDYVHRLGLAQIVIVETRNVGNAQRDGRPDEYRWRPLFNAAKFG